MFLRSRLIWAIPVIALAYLAYSLLLVDQAARSFDARWLYVSGTSWASGDSPYNVAKFQAHWIAAFDQLAYGTLSFAYPPTIALVTIPMGLMSWKSAQVYLLLLNLLALACIWYLSLKIVERDNVGPMKNLTLPLVIASTAAVSAVPATLLIGQTSILATLGAIGILWAAINRRVGFLVFFALLASIKPQISGLIAVYAIARFGYSRFGLAALGIVAVTAMMIAFFDPAAFVSDYRESLDLHLRRAFNQAEKYDHIGGALSQAAVPRWMGTVLTILAVIGIWAVGVIDRKADGPARRFPHSSLLLVFAATIAFAPLHKYDWIVLLPLLGVVLAVRRMPYLACFLAIWMILARMGNLQVLAQRHFGPGGSSYLLLAMLLALSFAAAMYWWANVRAATTDQSLRTGGAT